MGLDAFRESLIKHVAGPEGRHPVRSPLPLRRLGRPPRDRRPGASRRSSPVRHASIPLPSLPGAWVKHAAQGAALLADGLAGGRHADLVASLELARASGTVWDGLRG